MPIRLRATGNLLLDDVNHLRLRPPGPGSLVHGQPDSAAGPPFDVGYRFADGTAEVRLRGCVRSPRAGLAP